MNPESNHESTPRARVGVGLFDRDGHLTALALDRHRLDPEDVVRAGLVEARQRGTEHLYAVRLQGFQEVRAYLDEFWDVALSRLAALAQAEAHGEGGERSSDRREPEAS